MTQKIIKLNKGKHKCFEILSLLVHFYNNKYILEDVYSSYSQDIFQFNEISKSTMFDVHNTYNDLPNYSIKIDVYDNNNDFYYDQPSGILNCNLKFTYDRKDIVMSYSYDSDINLKMVSIDYGRINYYYISKGEQDKFTKAQNRMINRFKFYEDHADKILSKLHMRKEFNMIYRFKKYIDSIINYDPNEGREILRSMCRCVDEDMKEGRLYHMSNFLILKKQDYGKLILNIKGICTRTIKIDYPEYDNFFDIFTPIFKHLGGVKALQNIILTQRLMEE